MAKKRYYGGDYAGMENRKGMEAADSGMISSDSSATANLPQGVIMKDYPKYGSSSNEGLNDTLSGIDNQVNADSKKQKSGTTPEKY